MRGLVKAGVLILSVCMVLVVTKASQAKGVEGVQELPFQTPWGEVTLKAPMNGSVELLAATHLRGWLSCQPELYITTVGGFIYDRLGGSTSRDSMRNGLDTRYPGNPVVEVEVLRVDPMGTMKAEVLYEARHKDGLSVQRVLHLEKLSQGWRVVRVTKV